MGDQRADNETALREVKCMNDNGDRKDEQTIKACFMSDCHYDMLTVIPVHPVEVLTKRHCECSVRCISCGYRGAIYSDTLSAITTHNELCALVKKGRKYDEAVKLLTEINGVGVYMKIMIENGIEEVPPAHKEELLRVITRTSAFLARIDKEGGE